MNFRPDHSRWFASSLLAAALAISPNAHALELLVFAASSTADALTEAAAKYKEKTGRKVSFSFGASADLARQILAGAPAEVFLSADRAQLERLERRGLVRREEAKDLLSNQLVVVVPKGSRLRLEGAAELASVERLAIADPEAAPLGVYTRRWLESAGVWGSVQRGLVPTLDARAALAAAESGNVDAAIVYRNDASMSKRVRVALEVPRTEGPEIVYPIAPISGAGEEARAFIELLRGPEGRKIFEAHGFITLPQKAN